ncbi:hypothetical protein BDC45DRAFT_537091 [Circinella umbellata]|nr:hypothetical protein BDC45DRAFT_537091 [Circinella umbellata]
MILPSINEQEHDVNEILETVDVDDPTASETSYQQRELAASKEYLRKLVIMMKRKKKILDFNDKQMIQSQKVQILRTENCQIYTVTNVDEFHQNSTKVKNVNVIKFEYQTPQQ